MGKNLSGSALWSVEKLKTDILECSANSVNLLKPKNTKTCSSRGDTSTCLRKYEIISEEEFCRLCVHPWNTFPVNAILNLLDFVVACCVNRWGLKLEFVDRK